MMPISSHLDSQGLVLLDGYIESVNILIDNEQHFQHIN